MATVALVLYAVWAGTAFGLRMIIQLRRTGDTGFRGQAPRPGSAEWWARLLFVAALGLGVAAPVAARTGLDTFDVLDTSAFAVVGVALAALGIAGTLWAQLAMGDSWRIGVEKTERTDLVIGGLFGLVRNPIFTTMGVTAAGLALMVPNAVAVVGVIVLLIALELQVRVVEEPYLLSIHGDAFTRYASEVGRFLPTVGRINGTS